MRRTPPPPPPPPVRHGQKRRVERVSEAALGVAVGVMAAVVILAAVLAMGWIP